MPLVARSCMHDLGALYVAGDRACARGDVVTLADIAEHLVMHTCEPLHCELEPFARRCLDPQHATDAWIRLKQRIQPLAVRF